MERMFLSAAPYLTALGVESVIVGQGGDHPFASELSRAGYQVRVISPVRGAKGIWEWRRLVDAERPDLVHIHTEGAFASSVLGARWAASKAPVVRTVHNVFDPSGRARVSRLLQSRIADRWVSEFIAVSPDVRDNEQRFGRNCKLIFNWVDDRFFEARELRKEQEPMRPSAVIVGNASPIKNHAIALKAVKKAGCDLYYHGNESLASAEEKAILEELTHAGRVRYRGVGDPTTSLKEASVFLLPSKHEGMPIALSEALVVGVPAVINDAPGVQWARGFPRVRIISEEQDAWDMAVSAAACQPQTVGDGLSLPLDLSAKRGAHELTDAYRSQAR